MRGDKRRKDKIYTYGLTTIPSAKINLKCVGTTQKQRLKRTAATIINR